MTAEVFQPDRLNNIIVIVVVVVIVVFILLNRVHSSVIARVSLSICQPFSMRISVKNICIVEKKRKEKKRNARFVHPEQKDYCVLCANELTVPRRQLFSSKKRKKKKKKKTKTPT